MQKKGRGECMAVDSISTRSFRQPKNGHSRADNRAHRPDVGNSGSRLFYEDMSPPPAKPMPGEQPSTLQKKSTAFSRIIIQLVDLFTSGARFPRPGLP